MTSSVCSCNENPRWHGQESKLKSAREVLVHSLKLSMCHAVSKRKAPLSKVICK
jgi:hypothetical protein